MTDGKIAPEPPEPPEPEPCPGEPRTQYKRVVHVVPQNVGLVDFVGVATEAYAQKNTVGFSHDDAGIGALDHKTAVLWGIAPEQQETYQTWYGHWYPGTAVQFEQFYAEPPPIIAPGVVVDVSKHQGAIDWLKMKEQGVTHCYIRCTYGVDWRDEYVEENVQGARDMGIVYGLYHYFKNHQSAHSQATFFLDTMPGGDTGGLPPALDVERDFQYAPLYPLDLQTWLDQVEHHTNITPVIYTSFNAWNSQILMPQPWAARHPLWIANYTTADEPALPRDWETWWLWQYGKEPGAPYGVQSKEIDVNRFND